MEVASTKKREWHDFIPNQYHRFKKAFLESASEWFPERKKWDHAIDLKEDAPTSLDCRVYPLSQEEKKSTKGIHQDQYVTRENTKIQITICQWILPNPKERWKILPGTRLSLPKYMDNTQQISPSPHHQLDTWPCWKETVY
jgi:hypothetical protein